VNPGTSIANCELCETGSYQDKNGSGNPQILQLDPEFRRQDFQIYISDLSQRAGVPTHDIRKLVLKELVDNALDEMDRVGKPPGVTLEWVGDHSYTVTDQGRGFPDTPEQLAMRFSLDKAMISTKQWRKPTRGCVGNGLRVIVGSVVGSGRIIVKTRNKQVTLRPRLDGTTAVEDVQVIDWPSGTAVTIEINAKYPHRNDTLEWAQLAITLARNSGPAFNRNPSAWWYDRDHLALNMLSAIGPTYTLRDFVSRLDRCSSRSIQAAVTERFGKGHLCRDVNREEAGELLTMLRSNDLAVIKPKQLGSMGELAWREYGLTDGYACEEGTFSSGWRACAEIPFLVEAWAATCETPTEADDDDVYPVDIVGFTINRSPTIGDSESGRIRRRRDSWLNLPGEECDLSLPLGAFAFAVNITSPYVPIVSDNKSPTLGAFKETIVAAVEKAVRKAARANPPDLVIRRDGDDTEGVEEEKPERIVQRSAIWDVLPEAAERCREGGYDVGQRSLYYRVRLLVKELGAVEPKWNYFCQVLTDYENEEGEIADLIRDTRGVYCEPHGGEMTPLGTKTVAEYVRPPWKYSNILFLEKEDLMAALKKSGFLDRWDCFPLSSKGFGTRAARDLIDKIGASCKEEPTRFFCVHDADASGSLISQALTRATKARAARTVEVVDLGFFPWTALSEGLLREPVERKSNKRRAVSDYIKERDRRNRILNPSDEPIWESWLQDWRVELNAMTTAEFVEWMNVQFIKHGASKVVPSAELAFECISESLESNLSSSAEDEVREERQEELDELQEKIDRLEEEIGQEVSKRAADRFKCIALPSGLAAVEEIKQWLIERPYSHWRKSIDDLALDLIPEDQRRCRNADEGDGNYPHE
jgi:DNA topoisomerase VI subunit B